MSVNTGRVSRRTVLGGVWAAVLIVVAGPSVVSARGQEQPVTSRPPNIVLFIADDLGYRDIGPFGQDKIKTPNLDALASSGIKLTSLYSGNSVCVPSRNVLLSGRHPGHAHVRENGKPENYVRGTRTEGQVPVPPNDLSLPITLKSLGYATGGFGKWGLGPIDSSGSPFKQGFDRFGGYICQTVAHNYYPRWLWDDEKQVFLNNPDPSLKPRLNEGADPQAADSYKAFEGSDYAPDIYSKQALAFVRANKDKPFFLYYPTIVPHLGYQVPAEELKDYEGRFPELPFAGSGDYVPARTPRATYAAMITRMDREIGRILAEVRAQGLEENTIFIFISDNGAPAGNPTSYFNSGGIFRGSKGTIYDGAFRVPGIVSWKGRISPGQTTARVTGFEDFLPTLLELAGAKGRTPPNTDGITFAPTLLGSTQEPRPFLYREYPSQGQFVRAGDWKLIRASRRSAAARRAIAATQQAGVSAQQAAAEPRVRQLPGAPEPKSAPDNDQQDGTLELYNLATDPSEQHNVATENPDVVARLTAILTSQHTPSPLFPLAAAGEARNR